MHGVSAILARLNVPVRPGMPGMPAETVLAVQNCSELFRTVLGGLGILRWCGITLLKNVVPRPHNFEHWPTVL